MQGTRNNCFGSKKRNKTLCQTKIGKLECHIITYVAVNKLCCYISTLGLTCILLMKSRFIFIHSEIILASFLYLMMLFYKVIISHKSAYCLSNVYAAQSALKFSVIETKHLTQLKIHFQTFSSIAHNVSETFV